MVNWIVIRSRKVMVGLAWQGDELALRVVVVWGKASRQRKNAERKG